MRLRLSAFWFAYMASYGLFFPFYSLYLRRDLGLSAGDVGLVMAMLPLVGLVFQPLWGQLADRTGSRRAVLVALAAGAAGAYALLGRLDGSSAGPPGEVLPLALGATALFAVFATAVLPMATALSLATLSRDGGIGSFGTVRMWGTLGFLASILALPLLLPLLDASRLADLHGFLGSRTGLAWIFPLAAVCALGAALLALLLPAGGAASLRARPGDAGRLLKHRPVLHLLGFLFLSHLCLQGPIHLFPLLVDARGGDEATVSRMWIFMLALEIPLIGFSGRTLRRFGARGLLSIGLAAEGVRWTTCAFVTDLAVVQVVQLLHGVGVAGVIIGGPLYLDQAVPERLRSTGQALISAVGFGLASILSILAVGWLFERGGPTLPFALTGIGALTLAATTYLLVPAPVRPSESGDPS